MPPVRGGATIEVSHTQGGCHACCRGTSSSARSRHRHVSRCGGSWLCRAPRDRGRRPGSARARSDSGQGRGVRTVPHRHPRRARRLAGQAGSALHPGARGRRHRRGARRGSRGGRARRSCGNAVARLRLRHVRLLRLRLGDALPRAEEHGLLDRRRLRRVRDSVRPLRREGAPRASIHSTPPR